MNLAIGSRAGLKTGAASLRARVASSAGERRWQVRIVRTTKHTEHLAGRNLRELGIRLGRHGLGGGMGGGEHERRQGGERSDEHCFVSRIATGGSDRRKRALKMSRRFEDNRVV